MSFSSSVIFSNASTLPQGVTPVRLVAPTIEPVTLAEVKSALRITTTAHDTSLTNLIGASRQLIEGFIQQGLIKQKWQQTANWVKWEVRLEVGPLLSVESIEYIPDIDDDTWQTFSSDDYIAASNGRIIPRTVWPTHRGFQSFRETFYVGYNDLPDSPSEEDEATARAAVPEDLREAIKELTGHFFENPEGVATVQYETVAKSFGALPGTVREILDTYRKWDL